MELYAQYIKEREDFDMIYDENFFITYKKYEDETVFVADMFSSKEVRGLGLMVEFCNKFTSSLKEEGYKVVYGQTDESTNGWEYSDKLLRKYGFKYMGKDPDNNKLNNYCYEL